MKQRGRTLNYLTMSVSQLPSVQFNKLKTSNRIHVDFVIHKGVRVAVSQIGFAICTPTLLTHNTVIT